MHLHTYTTHTLHPLTSHTHADAHALASIQRHALAQNNMQPCTFIRHAHTPTHPHTHTHTHLHIISLTLSFIFKFDIQMKWKGMNIQRRQLKLTSRDAMAYIRRWLDLPTDSRSALAEIVIESHCKTSGPDPIKIFSATLEF